MYFVFSLMLSRGLRVALLNFARNWVSYFGDDLFSVKI